MPTVFKELVGAVNAVLYEQWDPLTLAGVAPRDEYESYVPMLIRLAFGEAPRDAIAQQLAQIEATTLSLTMSAPAHREGLADHIIALVRASGWRPPVR